MKILQVAWNGEFPHGEVSRLIQIALLARMGKLRAGHVTEKGHQLIREDELPHLPIRLEDLVEEVADHDTWVNEAEEEIEKLFQKMRRTHIKRKRPKG